MGYTHYWTPKRSDEKKFKEYSNTCSKLKNSLPDRIKIGDGGGYLSDINKIKPTFSKDEVIFNGFGELAHETFHIGLNQNDWDFCKTACKPYDLLVYSCLLAAVDILGYKISSDGTVKDWIPALEFYNKYVKGANFTEEKLSKELNR